jgi:epoxyqueuosine reductase
MKKRLKRIGQWMCETFDCDVKVFVDTAPVLEKPIAQRAGIGWQGKHTNVVSKGFGSWLFLSEIYTTLKLPPNISEPDHCGTCHKCLDICPTNAFTAPYQLDARKCISYLTIEHKGHIASEFRTAMGTRIYGCDDCLSVCPWNKFARTTIEPEFLPRDNLDGPAISTLLRLDDAEFRRMFSKSPVKRTGRDRLIRNTLIAAGNTGDRSLADEVTPLLDDPSPLVRAMAVWALAQLIDVSKFNVLRERYQSCEPDEDVLGEWRTAAV